MAKKFLTDINIAGGVYDSSGDIGNSGQVLSSTGSGVNWINANSAASVVYQDGFTGNGSTTAFTLANSIDNENKTQVYIDGVYQHKDNYSLSGTTLTFSTAPPNSSDIEVISFSSVSSADDILYDTDFGSAGLMTTNGSGVYSITTNNSANWNTAYTYSQVGHLPLAGGTLTGNVTFSSTTTFNDDITLNVAKLLKSSNNAASNFLDFDDDSTTHNPDSNVTTLASVSGIAMATNLNDGGGGAFTVSTGSTGTRLLTITTAGDATFARDVTVGRNLAADSGTVSHRLRSSTTTAAVLQVRPLGTRTGITPIIQYRQTETGGIKYLMAGTGGTYFGNYNSGIPTDASSMIRLSSDNSNNPSIGIGDSGSGTAHLDIGGNVLITNSGNSYLNGGNVGIGTTSPDYNLEIESASSPAIATKDTTNNVITKMFSANSQGFVGTESNHDLRIRTNNTDKLTITSGGNVGIGTTSPATKLHIHATSGDGLVRITGDNIINSGGTIKGFNNGLAFNVAPSGGGSEIEAIRIQGNGNVGIGTTSPASKFEVYGGNSGVNDVDRYIRFKASNGEKRFDFYVGGTGNASSLGMYTSDGTTKNVQIASGGTSYLNGGNVGIGTTSPNDGDLTINTPKLHVYGPQTSGAYNLAARFQAGNDADNTGSAILINHSNDRGLLIKAGRKDGDREVAYFDVVSSGANVTNMLTMGKFGSNYNVGIGTTTPSAKLNVIDGNSTFVTSDTNTYPRLTVAGGSVQLGLFRSSSNVGGGYIGADGSTCFHVRDASFATKLYLTQGGNLGIGNTNPLAKLQITSGDSGASSPWSNADELILESSGNAGLAFQTPNTGAATIAFQDPESVQAGFIQYLHADNALRFATNGNNERMRITSAGIIEGVGDISTYTNKQTVFAAYGDTDLGEYGIALNTTGDSLEGSITSNLKYSNGTSSLLNTARSSAEIKFANTTTSGSKSAIIFTHSPKGTTTQQEAMRINYNGAVGIGTTSPGQKLHIVGNSLLYGHMLLETTSNGYRYIGMNTSDGADNQELILAGGGTASGVRGGVVSVKGNEKSSEGGSVTLQAGRVSTGDIIFKTGVTVGERMRIDSGGHLSVSSRGAFAWQAYNFHSFENNSANEPVAVFYQTGSANYGINVLLDTDHNNTTSRFFMGAGASGSNERIKIYSNGNIQNSNNSYGQLSDINLKENIVDATSKLDEINQVRIVNFNYIGDVDEETNTPNKQIGVVAQELEQIFPGMVYECGDTEVPTKSVKYSVFVPMLIKAIQELKADNDSLRARIETLENN